MLFYFLNWAGHFVEWRGEIGWIKLLTVLQPDITCLCLVIVWRYCQRRAFILKEAPDVVLTIILSGNLIRQSGGAQTIIAGGGIRGATEAGGNYVLVELWFEPGLLHHHLTWIQTTLLLLCISPLDPQCGTQPCSFPVAFSSWALSGSVLKNSGRAVRYEKMTLWEKSLIVILRVVTVTLSMLLLQFTASCCCSLLCVCDLWHSLPRTIKILWKTTHFRSSCGVMTCM